ncbi:MAG: DUF4407 domain-containing protein [Ginsengibacter sp.]
MSKEIVSVSQRENYTPSAFTEFLWWLSTAEKELLVDCVIDRNRYKIIGTTVLATWSFATLAWTYFFSTVTTNVLVYVILGAIMGLIILTIDRALIKGITSSNKNKIFPLVFRGVLAITLGTFMAQPALLFLFDKEIKLQASLDNERRKQLKKSELTALYRDRKNELLTDKKSLEKTLNDKYDGVVISRNSYLSETDGSGGTGKIGVKDVAIAKRNEYQKLEADYTQTLQISNEKKGVIDAALDTLNAQQAAEEKLFITYFNDGFLTRIEALNNLTENNSALKYRYYLLVAIIILIELLPVLSKSLLPSGTYEEKVAAREAMEKQMVLKNINRERELKELYNSLAFDNDSEIVRLFFAETSEKQADKIRSFAQSWKHNSEETFDGLWQRMKKEIISKHEN